MHTDPITHLAIYHTTTHSPGVEFTHLSSTTHLEKLLRCQLVFPPFPDTAWLVAVLPRDKESGALAMGYQHKTLESSRFATT